mgnify:CR=1 FL=1
MMLNRGHVHLPPDLHNIFAQYTMPPICLENPYNNHHNIRFYPGGASTTPSQKTKLGLKATIDELGASTHLQLYLAEKIFQCMWWVRRYEAQKEASFWAS